MTHNCGGILRSYCSWTPENPGRRFEKCSNHQLGVCPYWEWLEPELQQDTKDLINNVRVGGEFSLQAKILIRHMLLKIWKLEDDKHTLQCNIAELNAQVEMFEDILGSKIDLKDD